MRPWGGTECQEKALGRECFNFRMNESPKGVRVVMVVSNSDDINQGNNMYEDRTIGDIKILLKCEKL